jgi:chromosomal replication initiation ATPase DnaA
MTHSQQQRLEQACTLLHSILDEVKMSHKDIVFKRETNVERILQLVAVNYNISVRQMLSKSRARDLVWARVSAAFLMKSLLGLTYLEVDKAFHRPPDNHHGASAWSRWACRKVVDRRETDPAYDVQIHELAMKVSKYTTL